MPSRRRFLASLVAAPWAARIGALAPTRPVRQSREHVVVVGAGAFGGWTALSLLRGGARVTLVDAWGAGNARASSGGETRVIRASYGGERVYSEMVARAFVLWQEESRRWQRQVYHRTGALWMCPGDDAYVRRSMQSLQALSLPIHELSLTDAAARYPQVSFAGVRTAFLEPEAGYLLARAACELVRETVVREGGEYRVAWARVGPSAGGRLASVALSDGTTLSAERFVFACGPWMREVFPDVIGRRIVATRQDVFFFGAPRGSTRYDDTALPVWVYLGNRLFYGIPGNERRGFKIADDTAGEEVDPTSLDRQPRPAALARARAFLRERFPGLAGAPLVETRVCQYEASSDGHYLVDRHPGLDNVWLVGGGSGHGFKMGPAMGEHVAALVQGRATTHPRFAYGRLTPRPR